MYTSQHDVTEFRDLIGTHCTDCMNKAMYGRVAGSLDFSESGLGKIDAPLEAPFANQVHVSVCIYFHLLLLLLKPLV